MSGAAPAAAEPRHRPVVLITGAAGLIGSRTTTELSSDYRVVGLDVRQPPDSLPDGAEFVECDLTSEDSTESAVRGVAERFGPRVASVIHLAAYYDFSGEPSPLYEQLTVEGTRRLLRVLRKSLEPEQFVFSSSLLVMRPTDSGEVIAERSPVEAEWDYPQSKLAAEAVIREEHGGIPAVVLRIAGVYDDGGHSPPLTQQIWRIWAKKLQGFLFPGDRSHGQPFVHLDDVARCLRATVERRDDLSFHEVFLIGEPDVMSYGELQDRIGELVHGREWPTLRVPAPVAKAGAWILENTPVGADAPFVRPWMIDLADAHYPITIERARRRLGWEPAHTLRDTLPAMVARMRRDPARFCRENDLPVEQDARPAEPASGA